MAKIRHIAIFSDNPKQLAEFYTRIYGMKITGESQGDVWVTDGYMDVALISRKHEGAPKGLHHFGFTLDEAEKPFVYAEMTKLGLAPTDPRADGLGVDRPFVEDKGEDPDGNRFDLTLGKRDMEEEKKRRDEKYKKAMSTV
jgi:catechol 2,3-dioxygenase-like lactoylglutathione lyase family enzyme